MKLSFELTIEYYSDGCSNFWLWIAYCQLVGVITTSGRVKYGVWYRAVEFHPVELPPLRVFIEPRAGIALDQLGEPNMPKQTLLHVAQCKIITPSEHSGPPPDPRDLVARKEQSVARAEKVFVHELARRLRIGGADGVQDLGMFGEDPRETVRSAAQ